MVKPHRMIQLNPRLTDEESIRRCCDVLGIAAEDGLDCELVRKAWKRLSATPPSFAQSETLT